MPAQKQPIADRQDKIALPAPPAKIDYATLGIFVKSDDGKTRTASLSIGPNVCPLVSRTERPESDGTMLIFKFAVPAEIKTDGSLSPTFKITAQ